MVLSIACRAEAARGFFAPGRSAPPMACPGARASDEASPFTLPISARNERISNAIPAVVAAVELGGVRTLLAVPMLKESEFIGAFALFRQEVRPFTDKQIELVRTSPHRR